MVVVVCLTLLAVLNGGWMLFDGLHVIRNGKYFGPEEPGNWSKIVGYFGINPFAMGPVFVLLGIAWLISIAGVLADYSWGWVFLFVSAISTLWYIKVGTVISVLVIVLLLL